jgi:hypothetical protein
MRAPATTFVLALALCSVCPIGVKAGDTVMGEIGTGGDMRLTAEASPLRIDAFAIEAGSGDDGIGRGAWPCSGTGGSGGCPSATDISAVTSSCRRATGKATRVGRGPDRSAISV